MIKNKKGFTILELLVVVAIIAILAAVAIPSFIGKIDKAKDSAELAEINAVGKAVALYYTDNGSYPTLQGVDASLSQPQPVDGSAQNVDFSKIVPNYLASLPHFSYWWVDYKGTVYHTQKPIGNVASNVFTPTTGYTYTLTKVDGSTQVLSVACTLQAGEYVIGKDEKGRDLPKISVVFKNEKVHPESPEAKQLVTPVTPVTPIGVGSVVSGDASKMLTAAQWTSFDWSTVKAPAGQVSGNVGVDSWGNPVNMDLWTAAKITDASYGTVGTVNLLDSSGLITPSYKGTIVAGKIEGYVPAKVKLSGETTFVDVTSMSDTFFGCSSLTTAPVIPSSVTNMLGTFDNCSSLTTAPVIPSSVTSMSDTFNGCSSLTTAPVIPNSVTNMSMTFDNCSSLTTAPVIPNSVTNMFGTFAGCSSLTTAPVIPNSVTNMDVTFFVCTSLTTAPVIPSSVTSMEGTFEGCTKFN